MGCFWPSKRKEPRPYQPAHTLSQRPRSAANGSEINSAVSTVDTVSQRAPTIPSSVAPTVSTVNSRASSAYSAAADRVPALLSQTLAALPENCRRFRYAELEDATRVEGCPDGFDSRLIIGEGGFGKVYRATLSDGSDVAVKRLDRLGMQGDKEFEIEVSLLGTLRHANIVTLRGVCVEGDHRCMLTDMCTNGSLRGQLDLREKGLGWAARIHVTLGAALGLAYLHDHAEPPVVHRDFKTSNILVDHACNGRVADFGLARRMKSRSGAGIHEPLPPECTVVMGTFGYVAPEYARTGTLNEKSDVYAFGVVLLEVLTSAEVVDTQRPLANRNLVDWLYSRLQDISSIREVVDPVLGDVADVELSTFCQLATWCLDADGSKRPRMSQAADVLRDISDRYTGDAVTLGPPTPPPADLLRGTAEVTPTPSGEDDPPIRPPTYTIPGAPSSDHAAMRSLSHEATIVVLDGNMRGALSIRDPFATSFAEFQPATQHLPQQKGYSSNGGGTNPFASLSASRLPPLGRAPQPPGTGQSVQGVSAGPPGESTAAERHRRGASFSASLDNLALSLGLSGPMDRALDGSGNAARQTHGESPSDSHYEYPQNGGSASVAQQPAAAARGGVARSGQTNGLPPLPNNARTAGGRPTQAMVRPTQPAMQNRKPPLLQQQQQQQRQPPSDLAVVPESVATVDYPRVSHVPTTSQPPYTQHPTVRHSSLEDSQSVPEASDSSLQVHNQLVTYPNQLPQPMLQDQYILQQQFAFWQQQQQQQAALAQRYQQQQQQQQPYDDFRQPEQQYGTSHAHFLPQQENPLYSSQPAGGQQLPPHVVQQALQAQQQHEMSGQQQQQVSGWFPRQQQLLSPSSPPWLQPVRLNNQRVIGAAPSAPAPAANPFHSAEPCMVCHKGPREWHLAPCGHAIGCKPCVLKIARIGEPCPSCRVHATGMLHQRFVHATPTPSQGGRY